MTNDNKLLSDIYYIEDNPIHNAGYYDEAKAGFIEGHNKALDQITPEVAHAFCKYIQGEYRWQEDQQAYCDEGNFFLGTRTKLTKEEAWQEFLNQYTIDE